MTLALTGLSQTDTVRVTKPLKETPESLKSLIEEIKAEVTKEAEKDADIEIDGLLFDETKTKSGKDFYDYFYRGWVAPRNAKNYSVFITEKPYRLTTTQIEIKINETLVFQSFMQPRGDYVEMLASQAVAQTQMYLQNYEEIVRQLDGDDRSGSGIY
jgi:curli production assembly/transport component CsgE